MEELAPGFRFYPTEEELVSFYLHKQLEGQTPELHRVIPVVDIYELEPWQLPTVSGELCHGDTEQWFFFMRRQEREARGGRPSRTTASGYWKATGSPGYVYSSSDNRVIGIKKNMVFYKGKAPTGRKTIWKMNEYRVMEDEAIIPSSSPIPKLRHEFSLCRVYVISGSFRAFDRRPPGAVTRKTIMTQQVHGNHGDVTTSHITTQVVEETSSLRSSYSGGDHVDLPANQTAAKSCNLPMVDGLEPLWEWEQLDWLYIKPYLDLQLIHSNCDGEAKA